MDCIKKPFLISSNIPYSYYKKNFEQIRLFLNKSEYNFNEEKPYRLRGYMNLIKPKDEITVIGRINKNESIKDPARFTIGLESNDIIVTNWSFSKQIKKLIFRIFGFIYSVLVILSGFYIALAVPISQINPEFGMYLLLVHASIVGLFVISRDSWIWLTRFKS